jgi:hypothetical protein
MTPSFVSCLAALGFTVQGLAMALVLVEPSLLELSLAARFAVCSLPRGLVVGIVKTLAGNRFAAEKRTHLSLNPILVFLKNTLQVAQKQHRRRAD